ncbi:hypothetical protein BASA83_003643 [Batrachochytrium salamandrivorans]|nr:hypothetical protein BASA83_003643 [Batrachochytrium salamandrivorans]
MADVKPKSTKFEDYIPVVVGLVPRAATESGFAESSLPGLLPLVSGTFEVSPSLLTQVLVRPFGSYRTQCFFPEGGQYATIDEIKTQLASRLGLPVSSVVHFGLCKESGEHVELDMSIADILASREALWRL